MCLIIHARFICAFLYKLPEDGLKKIETYRSINELHKQVYIIILVHFLYYLLEQPDKTRPSATLSKQIP
jgi:type III secretory pathway component EscU